MKHMPLNSPFAVTEGLYVDTIGKSFGDRSVVKSVSLRLARGEVAGLLGPNGAGKTTCFYMITGLVAADSGRILLDGQDITAQPMYQRARMGIGYLPQETSIFRGMSVGENVMAVVELRERDRAKVRETLDIIDRASITHGGEVLFEGSPEQILADPEVKRVYLGDRFA